MKTRNSVAGIAFEGGKVFTARRLFGGSIGGVWEFPGGKVREGESDGEALVREFREELSVDVEPGPFLGETSFVHKDIRFTLRAFRIRFLSSDFILSAHSAWRWAAPEELAGLDFAPSDKQLFPALEKLLPGIWPLPDAGQKANPGTGDRPD